MSSVTYRSTRGGETGVDFRTVVMQGLAPDKGLYVPERIPAVSPAQLEEWRSLSFADLAFAVISLFVQGDQIPPARLKDIIDRSYCDATFRHADITPVVNVGGHAVLELFFGPTFAFKDVALQMLGNVFEYFLETGSNGGRLAVLGATSGDTGSAAIAGLRGKRGIDCIILFPNNRVSEIQERQMTTILDENIHCVAVVDATFDDCQDLVKASFNTPTFRDAVHLGAVNSINWCRVLAQTTYYFWSYLRVTDAKKKDAIHEVHFSVPTGNFGDILAGYYAKQMGLPVGKLIVATNENDILHRFFTKGEYHRESIADTISPSMDICVSSNFERYLFHLAGNDPQLLTSWMEGFESTNQLTISGDLLRKAQTDFDSARVDTAETLRVIADYSQKHGYLFCPHSAVGVAAIHQLELVSEATVCLATAHPGKFPDAVQRALELNSVGLPPAPVQLAALAVLPTRRTELPNQLFAIQSFVHDCVSKRKKQGFLRSLTSTKNLVTLSVVVGLSAVVFQLLNRRR